MRTQTTSTLFLGLNLLHLAQGQDRSLQPWSEITLTAKFDSLVACGQTCLYQQCSTNYTCETILQSVDSRLGCISSSCICESPANQQTAIDYVKDCAVKSCNQNATVVDSSYEAMRDFCRWGDSTPTSSEGMFWIKTGNY
jgi:hypothetical protein